MAKYRKNPIIIDAVQWFEGDKNDNVRDLAQLSEIYFGMTAEDGRYSIMTLEGPLVIKSGDWIITGIQGEVYPVKPDIFEATYELMDDHAGPSISSMGLMINH